MTEQNCGNCHFYRDRECHRQPPGITRNGFGDIEGAFPPTLTHEWCGEWKLKSKVTFKLKEKSK